jgi:hypothetical protein
MITIGRMAERYGMLPSQIALNATTYDLMISDVLATYDKYQESKTRNKGVADPRMFNFSQDELKNMLSKD